MEEGIELGMQQGIQQGMQQEGFSIVLRLLVRKFSLLPDKEVDLLRSLSVSKLEELSDALLDFSSFDELQRWLQVNCNCC